jgi:hypothetical protein
MIARALVESILELLEQQPELAARARRLLGVDEAARQGPELVSRRQARELGVDERVLVRAERSGQIDAYRAGRRTTYKRGDVLALLERHRVAPPSEREQDESKLDPFERAKLRAKRRVGAR